MPQPNKSTRISLDNLSVANVGSSLFQAMPGQLQKLAEWSKPLGLGLHHLVEWDGRPRDAADDVRQNFSRARTSGTEVQR
eukprot:8332897-Pyramimonas_sp.AAC.1